jgi:alanine racemase
LALEKSAKKLRKTATVHLKFNTGMNRQGIDGLKNLRELIEFIAQLKGVNIGGMYSHFAQPENKSALKCQLDKFLLANNLVKGYNNKAISHVSASGGFLQGVQGDMVRIGILLYGYKPFDSDVVDVKPIMKLYSPVIKTRKLKAGQTALYGDKRLKKDSDIYLVRYGYADGLPRLEVGGQFNNRCMDLTAYTEGQICEHGFLVMEDAQTLAKKYRTISYEILTKCAIRAEKLYLR